MGWGQEESWCLFRADYLPADTREDEGALGDFHLLFSTRGERGGVRK